MVRMPRSELSRLVMDRLDCTQLSGAPRSFQCPVCGDEFEGLWMLKYGRLLRREKGGEWEER